MTFWQFCLKWNVTAQEARELKLFLAALRLREVLEL